MPRELPDLLAEAAPRDPGTPDLSAIESRARRRRAGRAGGTVLALAAAAALAVQAWPSPPDAPIIDEVEDGVVQEDGTTVLPLPAPGEVLPAHANGRPVFVVHADDGDVRVLDAISPHDSSPAAMKVLAYCTTSGWIVDPWHGSQFADNGAWVGGPAPHGLAPHEVLEVGTETVVVGRLQAAPARGVLDGTDPRGADCIDVGGTLSPGDLVLHTSVTEQRVPGLLYPERSGDPARLDLPTGPQLAPSAEPVTLTLPAGEDVTLRHVGQRPAIVLQHDSSDDQVRVTVLDGIDPHVTEHGPKVLTVCTASATTAGVVHDPWYLSRFATTGFLVDVDGIQRGVPTGGWMGGPAPTGLPRLPVLDAVPGPDDTVTITVLPTPLPAPPRVDLGTAELDESALDRLAESAPSGACGERDALFPGMPPADPTLIDDLLLQEPLFPDLWWYPTPERLLGEEPGIPPNELAAYLAAVEEDGRSEEIVDDPPPCEAGTVLLGGFDVDADGLSDVVVEGDGVESSAVLCTGAGEHRLFGAGPVEALEVVDLGLDVDVIAIGGTAVSSRFVELYAWSDGTFGTLDRLPSCEDPGGCPTEDREAFGLVDGLDPNGGSVDWGCLPARSATTSSVLVTVQVTPVEGGKAAVRIERFDVDGLDATLYEGSAEVVTEAGEFQAREILRDLGARIGCAA